MIRVFCNNKIKKILAIGLSVTFLFVALSPIRSAKADSVSYMGSPLTTDGIIRNTDYSDVNNYYDLLLRCFWENVNIQLAYNSSSMTLERCDTLLRFFLREYIDVWETEGFNPSILCNLYGYFPSTSGFVLYFDLMNIDDQTWSPVSYTIQPDGSLSYDISDATVFLPWLNGNTVYSVPNIVFRDSDSSVDNVFFSASVSTVPVTATYFRYSSNHVIYRYQGGYNPSASTTYTVGRYDPFDSLIDSSLTYTRSGNTLFEPIMSFAYSDFSTTRLDVTRCLASSFPYYMFDTSTPQAYLVSSGAGFNGYKLTFTPKSSPVSGVYFAQMSPYVVFSGFSFSLYATPTPYPTVLPSISPTPLPVAYDVNIDGMNDGSTLGFLQGMFNSLQNVSSTFTGVSWIASTIGYLFHYTPQFAFILFIPLIATLSFILGRNKS